MSTSALVGFAASIAAAAPAMAQTAPAPSDDAAQVEEVIVTGSRIRRDPTTAPTPLIQLQRDEILQSGQQNIVDFLADVPALSGSVVPEDTTGSNLNDGGLALLNLRDLGSVRTLVLVDGHRHVGSNPGTLSVDVDTIPSLLIQDVEIVTGGQSALYGADAVSGVVNFILRKNFEGIEVDGSLAQINQDGQQSKRLSALVGHNFLDDTLNVYAFAEHQEYDEVLDFDMDWRREAWGLTANDADPTTAVSDGDMDNVLLRDRRDAFFSRGGILVISNQPAPSSASDPDTPFQNCGAVPSLATIHTSSFSANCQAVRADMIGKTWTFNNDFTAKAFDFGTFQPQTGFSRRVNVAGDGLNTGTEFGQGSRLPESKNDRFQTGFNFDLTDNVQLFGEAKYVKETTYDAGQPTFFQLTIAPVPVNGYPAGGSSTSSFTLGLDNAYLNQYSPALVAAIQNNMRPQYNSSGVATGVMLNDPRAFLGVFGPSRSQYNERELKRYVLGARGDADQFGFIENVSWEASYTYGEMNNSNRERGVDSERFFFASDAVKDPLNLVGKGAGATVCRVQLLAAQGIVIPDRNPNSPNATIAANDPKITGCTPTNLFGTDFRSDKDNPHATGGGGRQGLTAEQADYLLATITVHDTNKQEDFLGYVSGEVGDFWGAGPIGVALGYEWRKESTESVGRDHDSGDRLLFLNRGPDFPKVSYDAKEFFTEVRVPLLKDLPFIKSAEISGAYRYSDYSTVGSVETYSVTANYKPVDDLFFRATYGKATRIPNLGENFSPPSQTFGNSLVDPCDANRIRALPTVEQRTQMRANCVATMPAGYDPGTDTASTGTTITYPSGVPGFNAGNPNLKPEESRSYTLGAVLTPRFLPNFAFTADYYDIRIDDVISSVSIQSAMNQCVGLITGAVGSVNPGACGTFTRDAAVSGTIPAYGVHTFVQGSLNYASTLAKGIDFTARYRLDLDNVFGHDLGRLDYSIRGNYLIKQQDFVNIAVPSQASNWDSTSGLPRVRFLSALTWHPVDKLALTWDVDWQSAQEIVDSDLQITNPDSRPLQYYTTGDFAQHDFVVRWDATDRVTLRAGVVNAFDAEPAKWLGSTTTADNFDMFGRRYYAGFNVHW